MMDWKALYLLFPLMGMNNKVKSNWDSRTLNYSNTVFVLLIKTSLNITKYKLNIE